MSLNDGPDPGVNDPLEGAHNEGRAPPPGEHHGTDKNRTPKHASPQLRQIEEGLKHIAGLSTGGLNMEEFRDVIRKMKNKDVNDKEIDRLFLQVDVDRKGTVDWDEYLSYMLLEKKHKEHMENLAKETPLPTHMTWLKSSHKNAIEKICFVSTSRKTMDLSAGQYATMGKAGGINIWDTDFNLLGNHRLCPFNKKISRNLRVTGMEAITNHGQLAMCTVEGEIYFVDVAVGKFDTVTVLVGLPHPILCLHYCFQQEDAYLVLGDSGGNVTLLSFKFSPDGLFGILANQEETTTKISISDVLNGSLPYVKAHVFKNVHDEWIRQVKYVPDLNSFISCTLSSTISLAMVSPSKFRTTYKLSTSNGVTCFDYDSDQKVIATGGMDGAVRIWNTYTTRIPLMVLKGYQAPVTHLICCPYAEQVIALSKDRCVKVWDLREQTCQQEILAGELDSKSPPFSSMFYNRRLQQLVLAGQSILLLRRAPVKVGPDEEPRSHERVITAALYNRLFDRVVSGCHGSVVAVWDARTGRKVMQFTQVHTTVLSAQHIAVEISSMRFDASLRRLITGGQNGQVKFWNFNNGECLRIMCTPGKQAVTSIQLARHLILCAGRKRTVSVLKDDAEDESMVEWEKHHNQDIRTMDYRAPSSVVTGANSGEIIIWNLQTGRIHRRLDVKGPMKDSNAATSTSGINHTATTASSDLSYRAKAVASETHITGRTTVKQSDRGKLQQKQSQPNSGRASSARRKTRNSGSRGGSQQSPPVINKLLFLNSRDHTAGTALLLAGCSHGYVTAWSLHHEGGLLHRFRGASSSNCGVQSMTTDADNRYLATGDTAGHVRIWLIDEYCTDTPKPIDWTFYQSHYTFLSLHPANQRLHASRDPRSPHVLTAFRAHLKSVTYIDLSVERGLLVTTGADLSVRLWTMCGRQIGTFGQQLPWRLPDQLQPQLLDRRLPRDVRRVASSTTLKLFNGGRHPHWKIIRTAILLKAQNLRQEQDEELEREQRMRRVASVSDDSIVLTPYKHDLEDGSQPILGQFYQQQTQYVPIPRFPPARFVRGQVMAYTILPTCAVDDISAFELPAPLRDLYERHIKKEKVTKRRRWRRRAKPIEKRKL